MPPSRRAGPGALFEQVLLLRPRFLELRQRSVPKLAVLACELQRGTATGWRQSMAPGTTAFGHHHRARSALAPTAWRGAGACACACAVSGGSSWRPLASREWVLRARTVRRAPKSLRISESSASSTTQCDSSVDTMPTCRCASRREMAAIQGGYAPRAAHQIHAAVHTVLHGRRHGGCPG